MACLLACLLTHVLTHSLLACAHLHLRIYVRAYFRTHSLTHARQASAYSLCVLTQGDRGARCTSTLAPRCRMQNEECDVLEMLGADRTTALLGVLAQTMRASTATAARGPTCGRRRNGGPAHGGAPRARVCGWGLRIRVLVAVRLRFTGCVSSASRDLVVFVIGFCTALKPAI